jgi:hypothetical protein
MVITDGGQGLQLVATSCSGGCKFGGTALISGVARAAYAGPLKGSHGYQLNISPQSAASIGVASFDGAGNVALSLTFVDLIVTSGQPSPFSGTNTGIYSINPDGSGTINLAPQPGQAGQTFVFVVTDGGSGALFLQTSRLGNGVQFGTARLQ